MKKRPALVLTAFAAALLGCIFTPSGLPSAPAASAIPTSSSIPPATLAPTAALPTGGFDPTTLADLYTRVNPGVVTVFIYLGAPHNSSVPAAQGTGFVIDDEGHIVTNQHVIEGADKIEVDFPAGLKTWAELLGTDPDSDLALLDVNVPQDIIVPLVLGDSDSVHVGDLVVAIGNPFGLSGTMTLGVISAIGRTLDSERAAPGGDSFFTAGDILQTDAALNPGNSGRPAAQPARRGHRRQPRHPHRVLHRLGRCRQQRRRICHPHQHRPPRGPGPDRDRSLRLSLPGDHQPERRGLDADHPREPSACRPTPPVPT